ncbi:hypothetical protein QCD58_004372 [Enterobacter hormaechei]|nr:hypothetical protein [Enterobacter hormaechei]
MNLTLSCEPGELAWQLMLSVTGNAVGFDADSATVATPQQADLAVKLLAQDKPVKMNAAAMPRLGE